MIVFRCVNGVLFRLGAEATEPPGRSSTLLGDWYVSALTGWPGLFLFISEPTYLPLVVKFTEPETMVPRFHRALEELLRAIDADVTTSALETDEHGVVVLARPTSPQVLGVMYALNCEAKSKLAKRSVTDLIHLSSRLSLLPCAPPPFRTPAEAARRRLAPGQTGHAG